MKLNKEVRSWITTITLAILISLLIVQGLTRLAFASADLSPLFISLSQFGVISYEEPNNASLPELSPLEAAVINEAQSENNVVPTPEPLVLETNVIQVEGTSIPLPTATRTPIPTLTPTQTLAPPTSSPRG